MDNHIDEGINKHVQVSSLNTHTHIYNIKNLKYLEIYVYVCKV